MTGVTSFSTERRQVAAVAVGVPLVMSLLFAGRKRWVGRGAGYLVGFAVYWVLCVAVAITLLGVRGAVSTLREVRPTFRRDNMAGVALLVALTVGAVWAYGEGFVEALAARPMWVAVAVPLAVTNGVMEELLWRGVPVRLCAGDVTWGVVVPSTGFALWHLAPQFLFPADDVMAFIVATFFLGLASGVVAMRSGSIRFSAISHAVNGVLALGGALTPAALDLLGLAETLA